MSGVTPGSMKHRSAGRGVRLAAAGLAGALFTAVLLPYVPAAATAEADSGEAPAPGPFADVPAVSPENDPPALPELFSDLGVYRQAPSAAERPAETAAFVWDEAEIFRRWDLEPEDFPEEEQIQQPEIPEELLSFFQEASSKAVSAYDGFVPPSPDLRKYTVRADAIRDAVRQKAEGMLRRQAQTVLAAAAAGIEKLGREEMPQLASALRVDVDDLGSDRALRGAGVETASAGTGIPSRKEEDASRVSGDPAGSPGSSASQKQRTTVIKWPLPVEDTAPRQSEKAPDPEISFSFFPENLFFGQLVSAMETDAAGTGSSENEGPGFNEGPDINEGPVVNTGPVLNKGPVVNESPVPAQSEVPGPVSEPDGTEEGSVSTEQYRTAEDSGDPIYPARIGRGAPFAERKQSQNRTEKDSSLRRTIMIGDSRTVGMQMYVPGDPEEYWSAKNSMGYSWMVNSGVPGAESLIGENTDVVILMGVNDLGNVARYVDYMNQKAAEWKERGARTFFVSVTPVIDSKSPNAKNARIELFNSYAQENLRGVTYIDAYSRIRDTFGSPDGIHFDAATYREIYRIIHFYLYTGWYEEAGLWFYFDRGRPLTGWQYLDGRWQYMDGDGVRWISNGRVGDICFAPFPETGMLDPYGGSVR